MKIIASLAYYLPGRKSGGTIRNLSGMVSRMGQDFQFRIITSDVNFLDDLNHHEVKMNDWNEIEQTPVYYCSPHFLSFHQIQRILNRESYDVLYLNSFFSWVFTIKPLLLRRMGFIPDTPVVLAPRGELSPGALAIKSFKKRLFILLSKFMGLHHQIFWQASSEYEAEEIRKIFGKSQTVYVAPDLSPRDFDPAFISERASAKEEGRLKIVYLSRVSEKNNLAGALQLLKGVKGQIEFDIWGPLEDHLYWEKCRQIMAELPAFIQVTYKGSVHPTQVKLVLSQYDLFFLPAQGESSGRVVLEALSAGCPVLISDQTPWRNLIDSQIGWDIPLSQPEQFISALQECIGRDSSTQKIWSGKAAQWGWQTSQDEIIIEQNQQLFHMAYRAQKEKARKKYFLIGPMPPPVLGQSVAFQLLCQAFVDRKIPHKIMDISWVDSSKRDGSFSVSRLLSLFPSFFSALSLLKKKRQVVYLTIGQSWNSFLRDFIFIFLAWLGQHRLILHLHGGNYKHFFSSQPPLKRKWIRWTLSKASQIVILGESLRDMFDFIGDSQNRIVVVPNGLPIKKERLPVHPKQLPEQGKPFRILYLSNLIETKGYLDVLAAVRLLKEKSVDVQCHFCGQFMISSDSTRYASPAEAEQDFIRRIKEYGLEKEVKWTGPVDDEEKEKELNEGHFFILPTNYINEGQPLAIIEALAYGCVVISTNYRAIGDMLVHSSSGVFVRYGSPLDIAEAVMRFTEARSLYKEMSQNAMEHYRSHFTREAHLDAMLQVITGTGFRKEG